MTTYQKFQKLNINHAAIDMNSEEYYEIVPETEVSQVVVPEWKVTYEGGFYPKRGREGKEVLINKDFVWGNEIWHIPAVYLCTKGMVVDFCVEVEPKRVETYINKWNLYEENGREYSHSEYEQIHEEHPLNMEFHSNICVNGNELRQAQGCGVYWIPSELIPDDMEAENEAKWILEHYGYDLKKAWAIHRISYPWTEKKPRTVKTLEIKLEREMAKVPCVPFIAPEIGESHLIKNPVIGVEYTFTVRAYEEREMDPSRFGDDSMEWPANYAIMTYTLFPELNDFILQDVNQGDFPRRKKTSPHGPIASSVGIIGLRPKTEDGTEYYHPDGSVAKLRVCCSGMYFEKPENIFWKLTFREKRIPDIEVKLL